jgi:hypothetical protein
MAMLMLQMFLSECQKFLMFMVLLKINIMVQSNVYGDDIFWNEMFQC